MAAADRARRESAEPAILDGEAYADVTWLGLRMAGAAIRDATFSDCTFERCSFAGTTFSSCSFSGCRFDTCDLSLATVPGTRFMDVEFDESKLVGVDWTTVGLMPRLALSVRFERCNVSQSILFGLDLRRLVLRASTAEEADFRNADLSDADLVDTDFAGARFGDTTLIRADFRGARNYAIDPLHNRIAKARFSLPDAVALLAGLDVRID